MDLARHFEQLLSRDTRFELATPWFALWQCTWPPERSSFSLVTFRLRQGSDASATLLDRVRGYPRLSPRQPAQVNASGEAFLISTVLSNEKVPWPACLPACLSMHGCGVIGAAAGVWRHWPDQGPHARTPLCYAAMTAAAPRPTLKPCGTSCSNMHPARRSHSRNEASRKLALPVCYGVGNDYALFISKQLASEPNVGTPCPRASGDSAAAPTRNTFGTNALTAQHSDASTACAWRGDERARLPPT